MNALAFARPWAALALACLLPSCGNTEDPVVPVASDVERCRVQLARIYAGLVDYAASSGHAPAGNGVPFFGALIAEGTWPADDEHARLLICPGTPDHHPEGAPADWFRDAAALASARSSYAGRDQSQHPLPSFPTRGDEVLIACGISHSDGLNALFADGSVVTYLVDDERERGTLPADADAIRVGPDSPIEALRKLVPSTAR